MPGNRRKSKESAGITKETAGMGKEIAGNSGNFSFEFLVIPVGWLRPHNPSPPPLPCLSLHFLAFPALL
jgi:hypothetical protein